MIIDISFNNYIKSKCEESLGSYLCDGLITQECNNIELSAFEEEVICWELDSPVWLTIEVSGDETGPYKPLISELKHISINFEKYANLLLEFIKDVTYVADLNFKAIDENLLENQDVTFYLTILDPKYPERWALYYNTIADSTGARFVNRIPDKLLK